MISIRRPSTPSIQTRKPGTQDAPNPVIRAIGRKIAHKDGP